MTEEARIEAAVVKAAEASGQYARKFNSDGNTGVPDHIFVGKNGTLFIEFKAPGELPTDKQADELRAIRKAGGCATWCDSTAAGIELLTALDYGFLTSLKKLCDSRNAKLPKPIAVEID